MNLQALRAKWPLGIGAAIAFTGLLLILVHDLTFPMRYSPEAQAVGRLRDIFYRQVDFRTQHGCFAREVPQFAEIKNHDHDYAYAMAPETTTEKDCILKYTITASPVSATVKGARYFSVDQEGIIRFEKARPTGPNSPILK